MRPQYVFAVTTGLAVATSFASAATYSFTNITGNSATNAAAGEAQLSLSTLATANPQLVKISLTNGPGLASAVRCIFVDDSAGILAALGSISNTAGITFNAGTSGALPGGENVSFVANHSLGLTADPPPRSTASTRAKRSSGPTRSRPDSPSPMSIRRSTTVSCASAST